MFKKLFLISLAVFAIVFVATPVTATTYVKAKVVKKMVPAKQPVKKVVSTAPADWFVYEAMWVAGGQSYQNAVYALADVYAKKMDKHCRARINVADAAKAYGVAIPKGAEAIRNVYITKQIATLACITMRGERYATSERMM